MLFAVLLLFFLLALLLWRIIAIGMTEQDNYARLYAIGLGTLVIVQTFSNVGMNLGFLPIIGLSLPFVSYGGSLLIGTYIGLGLLLNIKVKAR